MVKLNAGDFSQVISCSVSPTSYTVPKRLEPLRLYSLSGTVFTLATRMVLLPGASQL